MGPSKLEISPTTMESWLLLASGLWVVHVNFCLSLLPASLRLCMSIPVCSSSSPPSFACGEETFLKAIRLGIQVAFGWPRWGERVDSLLIDSLLIDSLLCRFALACCSPGRGLFYLSSIRQLRMVYLLIGLSRHPVRYNQANKD